MSNDHTPTPWRIGNAGLTVFGPKSDASSPVTIAHAPSTTNVERGEISKANIAYIVECVNSHAGLVSALRHLLDAGEWQNMIESDRCQRYKDAIAEAHNALAQVSK